MKNITYYSAGAGSGKTYTLTHKLADKIEGVIRDEQGNITGQCEAVAPSEIILTTFTKLAAADFKERARAVLYKKGLHEQAALLDQAIIGTVHSVGEKFVHRYWYLLGLSPDMKVMDDNAAEIYINQSLYLLPSDDDIKLFHEFQQEFNITKMENRMSVPDIMFWKNWLKSIIDYAQSYRINDFTNSRNYSLEKIREYFGSDDTEFDMSKERFLPILKAIVDIDGPNTTEAAQKRYKDAKKYLDSAVWSIIDYTDLCSFLAKLPKGHQKSCPEIPNAVAELSCIWNSKKVYSLLEKLVNCLFDLAERWKDEYIKYKQEMRILDFNDLEVYMLQLLENKDIAAEISGKYKCLFVDEFQDSSPIQVEIFNRLSDLVNESFWCGDSKQAIYGFRGADTDLTEAVANMIPKENMNTLKESYRSEPDIVNFCNEVFSNAFKNKLPEDKVKLNPTRDKKSKGANLTYVASTESTKDNFIKSIACFIEKLIEECKNNDGDSFSLNDIAVLAYSRNGAGSEVSLIAEALNARGIPVNVGTGSILMQKETELISAILTLIVDPYNQLAKAKIVHLTDPNYRISNLVDERLEYLQNESEKKTFLADNKLIERILTLRKVWQDQDVTSLIESIIIELNLRAILKSWDGSWEKREKNLFQILNIASEYVNYCDVMTLGATTTGFLDYLQTSEAISAGESEGITLNSYHQSKGLQWKNVILLSLDHDFTEDKTVVLHHILGVQKNRTTEPNKENLFPEMIISFIPQIFPVAFGKPSIPDFISNNIIESEAFQKAKTASIDECKRLLYVGMTRAENKLILTAKKASRGNNPHAWLESIDILNLPTVQEEDVEIPDFCGTGLTASVKHIGAEEVEAKESEEEKKRYDFPCFEILVENTKNKYIAPSTCLGTDVGVVSKIAERGKRIPLRGENNDMDRIGTCIHNAYAACNGDKEHDVATTQAIIKSFFFDKVLPSAEEVVESRNFLINYLKEFFGPFTNELHEIPFYHLIDNQIVRGSMDLVIETKDGCILIDFKSFPRDFADVLDENNKHYAGLYRTQFDYYRAALSAKGKKILKSFVYYPINGAIIEIGNNQLEFD